MDSLWNKIELLLAHVSKPGRYVGNELHAIQKSWNETEVHFVLAFPDAYEIGMSHLGIEILYHILNKPDWIACERVYSPWPDMEHKMREHSIPLFSIESKFPIRLFDVLGISLQYELQYTNVLNLIDLAGIPMFARDRSERDPLVIAGGPCAFNPEPLADFLDAVVLGDGEEVVMEIAALIRKRKREHWNRRESLKALSKLDGVYVPSFYRVEADAGGKSGGTVPVEAGIPPVVRARTLSKLSSEHYPDMPLVPLVQVTHDRLSLEIMRGCNRGCRFCSAGMIYRPVRIRSVEDLVQQAQQAILHSGYDEISLVSLSTSDYPDLPVLLRRLKDSFDEKGISISFPSLRPDTFTRELADLASGLRKSGLTLAPEAGTQRLRNVINKNNGENDLLESVRIAFEHGWKRIKLYFMIGLPTETEEDVKGISDLVGKVVQLSKQYGRKEIGVSISPFSPKPHTPFQWEAQNPVPMLQEKIDFLKRQIRWREVQLNWRDPRISQLETVLGRGDRSLGRVVHLVWEKGARFDAWGDRLDMQKWDSAFSQAGSPMASYTSGKSQTVPLPWSHLEKGIAEAFLIQERARAFQAECTPDCSTDSCTRCGLEKHPACGGRRAVKRAGPSRGTPYEKRVRRVLAKPVVLKIRCEYSKGSQARFSSHLDTIRMFVRTLRRANVGVAYSQGYHAHPLLSFGPPLPLGFTSRTEYVDIEILEQIPRQFDKLINRHFPPGFEMRRFVGIPPHAQSLDSAINLAQYRIVLGGGFDKGRMMEAAERLLKFNSYKVKRGEKDVDIRLLIIDIRCENGGLDLSLRIGSGGSARPDEVLDALLPRYEDPPEGVRIERTHLFVEKQGLKMNPMEIVYNE